MDTSVYLLELARHERDASTCPAWTAKCFDALKRSLWQAKVARTLVFMISGFAYCGSRLCMVRIHEQWGRLFTLNDKTIALECSDDFFSAREGGQATILEPADQFLADEDNSAHLPDTLGTSSERMFAFVRQAGKVLLNLPTTDPLPPVDRSLIYGTSLELAPSLAFLESWTEPNPTRSGLPSWPPSESSDGSDAMDVASDVGMEGEVDPALDVNGSEELPQPMEIEVECLMGDVQGINKADFLSLPTAIERAEVFLESMRIDDGQTEGSMTERSTTVEPYDQFDRNSYCSSCSEYSTNPEPHDQQTEVLLSILDKYDVRLVLVSRSEMDELAGMTPAR